MGLISQVSVLAARRWRGVSCLSDFCHGELGPSSTKTDTIRDSPQIGRVFGCWATIIQRIDVHYTAMGCRCPCGILLRTGRPGKLCLPYEPDCFFPETRVCLTESNRTCLHYTEYCTGVFTWGPLAVSDSLKLTTTEMSDQQNQSAIRINLRTEHIKKRPIGKTPP